MLRIDILRHGETALSGCLRGSTDDALTAQGWSQMQAGIAPYTQAVAKLPWQALISSPLQRCQDFAVQLAAEHQIPLLLDRQLQEMHFGDWEGQSTADLYQHFPEALAQFWQQPSQFTPPNAEPLLVFQQRVLRGMQQIQQRMQAEQWQRVLLISHGGVIKLLKSMALAQPLDQLLQQSAELGQLHGFEYTPDGQLQYRGAE